MHAKEEGIIRALKEISKTENEVAKKAIANNHMDVATHTLIVARVTAEAAEIIAKQDHTSPCRHRRHRAGNSAAGYSLPRHPEWHDEVNHYDGRVPQGLATTAPRSGA